MYIFLEKREETRLGLRKTSYIFSLIEKLYMLLIYHEKELTTIEMFTRKIRHMQKKMAWKNFQKICFT